MTYVEATGDTDFLTEFGAEILFETSRFWVDRTTYEPETERLLLKQVMGPDEFHSHVDNNAFTNRLAQWAAGAVGARLLPISRRTSPTALAAHRGEDRPGAPKRWRQWRDVAAQIVYHLEPARGARAVQRVLRAAGRARHRVGRERHAALSGGLQPLQLRGRPSCSSSRTW